METSFPHNMGYFYVVLFHFFFSHGAIAPSDPWPRHYRPFTVTLRHSTFGWDPLEE